MKMLIVAVMVLALAGIGAAQDMSGLDMARSGVQVESQPAAQQPSSSVYDLLVAKVLAAENQYMRGAREQVWSQYLGMSKVVPSWGTWNGSWMTDREAWDQWDTLTPAEQAQFQGFMRDSWNRVIAAGLN